MHQVGGSGNTFIDIIPHNGGTYTSIETTKYLQCAGIHMISATEIYFLAMQETGTVFRVWLDFNHINNAATWGQGIGYETFDNSRTDIYAAIDSSSS